MSFPLPGQAERTLAMDVSLLLLQSACLIVALAGWENMILTTQSLMNCPRNATYPNPFVNTVLGKNGESDGLFVSGDLEVADEVSYGAMIKIIMIKCIVDGDDSSCRPYKTFEVEFCSTLFNGKSVWSQWVDAIQGFGPCPILPAKYPIVDMPMDFNSPGPWHAIPNPEHYIGHWKMEVNFVNGNVLETCILLVGDVKKRRRQSKKINLPLQR